MGFKAQDAELADNAHVGFKLEAWNSIRVELDRCMPRFNECHLLQIPELASLPCSCVPLQIKWRGYLFKFYMHRGPKQTGFHIMNP